MTLTAELHGVDELRAALRRAEREIELQAAILLLEAGEEIRRSVAAEAPRGETGNLQASITRGPVEAGAEGRLLVRVYEDERTRTDAGVGYGTFVQQGTRAHPILPRRRKALRFEGGNGTVFAKRAQHPGTRANPFWDRGLARAEPRVTALAHRLLTRVRQRYRG